MTPPGITKTSFNAAIKAFCNAIGAENVFIDESDQLTYADHYSADETKHLPSGGVAPSNTEEVQAVIKIANQFKVPLWTMSRGKNFGYGGAAPVQKGAMVLDLTRMKKIEFDIENGTVLVEPGVSFFDLHDYIIENKLPYWLSVPGNSWGSVAGNALDRGVGYTPYGDHADRICGLEVVLPDGDLVRTGNGAMTDSPTWNLYKPGFGPSWDTMFCQSNFGVVTKLGLWLMPAPEAMMGYDYEFDKPEDLEWVVDTLAKLRREGVIQQSPSIGNWLRSAAVMTKRSDWTDKPGTIDETVITAIRNKFNIGWWGVQVRCYGAIEMVEASMKILNKAFNGKPLMHKNPVRWLQSDGQMDGSPMSGVPISLPLANANWHGGRGGHISYSPVLPAKGDLAIRQFRNTYALYQKYDMDYHSSFAMGERHLTNVNQVLFDRDNKKMMGNVDKFFTDLVADATQSRYSEYRTHIDYMDTIANTFDFNNHALLRLNHRVKDALDPNGILAPGKSGIWPAQYRGKGYEKS